MPHVNVAAPEAVELSWNSFPAPPPEAAAWKPDLDSVPVAGGLPDLRFNKDPFAVQFKQTQKRDKLFGRAVDRCSEITSPSSPSTKTTDEAIPMGRGCWPTPVPRAAAPAVTAWRPTAFDATVTTTAPSVPPKKPLGSMSRVASSLRSTDNLKGTMETLPVQPPFLHPPAPAHGCFSEETEVPYEKPVPAWARPLEHLLKAPLIERPSTAQPAVERNQPAALSTMSTPPHLRKRRQEPGVASTESFSGPKLLDIKFPKPSTDEGFEQSKNMLEDEVELAKKAKDIQHQKILLESLIPAKSIQTSEVYQRYIQTKLISILEDEMDVQDRTTRREIRAMSSKQFASHFDRIVSMHARAWDLKQKRGEIDNMI